MFSGGSRWTNSVFSSGRRRSGMALLPLPRAHCTDFDSGCQPGITIMGIAVAFLYAWLPYLWTAKLLPGPFQPVPLSPGVQEYPASYATDPAHDAI